MNKLLLFVLFLSLFSCNSQDDENTPENFKAKWINDAFNAFESGNYPK